jgi:hypothetical protein
MIGNNQLNLNAATVMQALQEWINKRMGEHAPRIVSINFSKNGFDETYCVGVESPMPTEGKSAGSGE